MDQFAIIEIEDGSLVIELLPGQNPEDAAASQAGVLVDAGPYSSYEEANDALIELQSEGEEEQE